MFRGIGTHQEIATGVPTMLDKTCLPADLGSNVVVGKSGSRKEGDLLASSNGIHSVNGGNASLDHLLWVCALCWVDGCTGDIHKLLSQNRWPAKSQSWTQDVYVEFPSIP